MLRRGAIARVLVAFAFVGVGLGSAVSAPADAQDPEVCGYVRYSTSTGPTSTGPTSTVPHVPHCERPCGGPFVHVPTTEVGSIHYEALVCVRGI